MTDTGFAMRNNVAKLLIATFAFAVATSTLLGQELAPDLILFNGKVFTVLHQKVNRPAI